MANVTVNKDMVGTRTDNGRVYPLTTIGGRNFNQAACVRIRLDDTHFCVKDPVLSQADTESAIEQLRALVAPSGRTTKVANVDES